MSKENNGSGRILKFKRPPTDDENLFLDQITGVVQRDTEAVVRLQCILQKRMTCYECIADRVFDQLSVFYDDKFDLMMTDVHEFMRQLVMWAVGITEYELKQPCEKENQSE
jgi:hypothetical protein